MSTGLLFVTAPEADYKLINRILLRLRAWNNDYIFDSFKLVTTKNAYDLEPPVHSERNRLPATSPTLSEASLDNAWAGASLEDVEAFCLDVHRAAPFRYVETTQFLLVDSEALHAAESVIGCRRGKFTEEEDFFFLDEFDKMRIPQDQVFSPWANFELGNMQFWEFTQEEQDWGLDEWGELNRVRQDGWFTYRQIADNPMTEEQSRYKEEQMAWFEGEGWI